MVTGGDGGGGSGPITVLKAFYNLKVTGVTWGAAKPFVAGNLCRPGRCMDSFSGRVLFHDWNFFEGGRPTSAKVREEAQWGINVGAVERSDCIPLHSDISKFLSSFLMVAPVICSQLS